jgi:hypothetical protein
VEGLHSGRHRALDVFEPRVPHVERGRRLDPELPQGVLEDPPVGLLGPHGRGVRDGREEAGEAEALQEAGQPVVPVAHHAQADPPGRHP